ncbi:MAG: hypothetical protein ACRD5H_00160 [Nitrososphaerales archaeon]
MIGGRIGSAIVSTITTVVATVPGVNSRFLVDVFISGTHDAVQHVHLYFTPSGETPTTRHMYLKRSLSAREVIKVSNVVLESGNQIAAMISTTAIVNIFGVEILDPTLIK